MVFVNDCKNDDLEEPFLNEDENGPEAEVEDVTANRVTTPVDIQQNTGPLHLVYTQTSQPESELDLQPSWGPGDQDNNSMGDIINNYLYENLEDVLRTCQIRRNFSLINSNSMTGGPTMPLGWIVPDGSNQMFEEIQEKKVVKRI